MTKRLSSFEEDILTLLTGKQGYGLAIIRAFKEFSGQTLRVGSLYPALHKMEEKGLIRSWWEEGSGADQRYPQRRYYTATEYGTEVLKATQQVRRQFATWREGRQ